jgi:ABC-2 type transport system permease protein
VTAPERGTLTHGRPAPAAAKPAGRSSGFRRRVTAQTIVETKLMLRRGENFVFTIVLPVLVLVFFSKVDLFPATDRPRVEALMPIVLAIAVMSTSFVGLAIATGYERKYKVLKRLGISPLGRPGLVWAKILAVGVVEAVQVALLLGVGAVFLGWRFHGDAVALALGLALGSAAFGSLGMLLAGTLAAEATLALTNAIYVVLVMFGGVAVPLAKLPGAIRAVGSVLPSAGLATGLRGALAGDPPAYGALGLLLVWTAVGAGLAVATFRWE